MRSHQGRSKGALMKLLSNGDIPNCSVSSAQKDEYNGERDGESGPFCQ
jgi:hypothetical protein